MNPETTDYVIIGAGSAGCVMANRLSENPRNSVTLLEAGGSDKRFWVKVPIGYGRTFFDSRVNWMYRTEKDAGINNRSSYWPRGRVLGGSSSINAMVYIRGHQRDFDDWRDKGNPGWGYEDVLPYFKKSEDSELAEGSHHSKGGPLHVSQTHSEIHHLCDNWLQAARESGLPVTDDFNGAQMEGAGIYSITTRNGVRESTASAFLDPAKKRDNLRVITGAQVSRIEFDGKRAVGVEYRIGRQSKFLKASKEVILSAGAINSPQLLELSGVGNPDILRSHGIDVVHANSNVGEHLQDHIGINYYYKSRVPTINDKLYPLTGKLREGLKYVLTRKGHLSLSVNQAGGFVRSNSEMQHPNLQLYFTPISYTQAPENKRPLMNPDPYSAFLMSFQPCRPTSRGHLHIKSNDPMEHPSIQPNYLQTNEDVADILEGAHLIRKMAAAPAFAEVIESEISPGKEVTDDEALIDDFRHRADTVFHPIGTCAMGPDPASSVVDPECQVHGLEGLRVVDASIFPNLTSGNTNAPTIMVAEKAADMILGL